MRYRPKGRMVRRSLRSGRHIKRANLGLSSRGGIRL